MKPRLAVVVAALAAVAAIFAVGSASGSSSAAPFAKYKTIAHFTIGQGTYYSTLDPSKNQGYDMWGMLDNLVRFGNNGTGLEPWLAQQVTQPGPAVYVYHLRHGVKFWDGKEMTSADVANSLNYYRYPQFQTSAYYRAVKSITTPSKYTVVVTLKHRDASWPTQMAWQGAVFEKAFQQAHKTTFGHPDTGIMGTGAFVLKNFEATSGIETVANPHWWGGRVNVQKLSIKFFNDETSMAIAFRSGAIDEAETFDARGFSTTANTKLLTTAAFTDGYFGMNFQVAPFNNVHVRRAVAYAIDKAGILKAVGSPGRILKSLIPSTQLYTIASKQVVDKFVASLPQYPYDLAKAKAELAQSPYPNGFTTKTDSIAFGTFPEICQIIAASLTKIGINMKVSILPGTPWVAMVYGPKTYPTLFTTVTLPSPDPSSFPSFMLGSKAASDGGGNFGNYNRPSVDTDIKNSVQATSNAGRWKAYQSMLKSIAEDVPYVPIYQQDISVALSDKYTWPGFDYYKLAFGPFVLTVKPK